MFDNDGTIEDRKTKYEEHSSLLDGFIKEYCEEDVNGSIPFSDLQFRYMDFRKSKGARDISKIELSKSLKKLGYETKTLSKSINNFNTTERHILGIIWRYEIDDI